MQEDVFQRYVVFTLVCVYVKVSTIDLVSVFGCTNIRSFGMLGLTFNSMWFEGHHFCIRKIDES